MTKKILFVDGDRDWRSMVELRLQGAGYEVFLAADASEAMAFEQDLRLDLIILELNLGGEDGRQLMKFLKRNDPQVRIVLYTGSEHGIGEVEAMMLEGAYRYVQKAPHDNLLNTVQHAFPQAAA